MHGQPAGIKARALATLKDKSRVQSVAPRQRPRKQISFPSQQPGCNFIFYFSPVCSHQKPPPGPHFSLSLSVPLSLSLCFNSAFWNSIQQ